MTEAEKAIRASRQRASEKAAEGSGMYYATLSGCLEGELIIVYQKYEELLELLKEKARRVAA